MQVRQNIANFLTLLNLLSGSLALYFIFQDDFRTAFLLVLAGIGFDFLDGLVARATGTGSELGLQLDSMADLITSGLVPGYFLFQAYRHVHPGSPVAYVALLIPAASAVRLARFNLDTRQKTHFIGLPTPANALFLISLGFILLDKEHFLSGSLQNPWFFSALILLSAWLLNSSIPLIALKFKGFSPQKDIIKILLVLTSGLILALKGIYGIPLIMVVYFLFSYLYFSGRRE